MVGSALPAMHHADDVRPVVGTPTLHSADLTPSGKPPKNR
jgi:hypothetical protein